MMSSSETCHLGSSSNNQVIDQQSLLANNPTVDEHGLLPDTLESENYPHYVLNSHEVGMPSGQQNTSLTLWDSAGSSSMGFLGDHDSLLQAKREHFAPSLSMGGPLIIEGRIRESSSSLPSHLNIDLNLNQADQFETGSVDMVQSSGQSGMNAFPLNRGLSTAEHVHRRREISPGVIRSSSHNGNLFDDTAAQEAGGSSSRTANHFCSSIKRKNIAGSFAESSANGSSRNHGQNNNMLLSSPSSPESTDSLSMPTSTNYGFSFPHIDHLNQDTDTSADAIFPGPYTLSGHLHENERFLRNTRLRMTANEYDESLPNLLPEGSFRCSARQPAQQQSSFTPVQPRAMSSSASSHNGPHVPAVAQFSQSLRQPPSNGNFGSRVGSSSSSADTVNLRSSQDPGRSLTRSNLHEPFVLGPSMFSADSTNLLAAPGSRSDQQNSISSSTFRAAADVGLQQVPGLNVPQPSSAARGSTEIPRRSSLSASVSHSRSSNIALQHRGHSSSLHEIRSQQPGSSSRASLQHYSRAVLPSIDRQNSSHLDLQSFMQSIAASREGSRSISEVCFPGVIPSYSAVLTRCQFGTLIVS
jgi:hypothetical protein